MARLPEPGSDQGVWGAILNEYLTESHKGDGTLKDSVVKTINLQNGAVTEAKLATSVAQKLTDISSLQASLGTVQSSLGTVQSSVSSVQSSLSTKADTSHTHAASDIASGTFTLNEAAPGTVFRCPWNGTQWTYNGTGLTARPSSRTDLYFELVGAPAATTDPAWILPGDSRMDI